LDKEQQEVMMAAYNSGLISKKYMLTEVFGFDEEDLRAEDFQPTVHQLRLPLEYNSKDTAG